MPVARDEDRRVRSMRRGQPGVQHRDDVMPVGNLEGAARAKIVLNIDQ